MYEPFNYTLAPAQSLSGSSSNQKTDGSSSRSPGVLGQDTEPQMAPKWCAISVLMDVNVD